LAARGARILPDLACGALLLVPGLLAAQALARVGWSCAVLQSGGDPGLVGYLLEWGYQFASGSDLSATIWSPPFFFPEPNLLAYSDTYFSAYPFYFPARWLGADPHRALLFFWVSQLWLTPVVTYTCARRWLGLDRLPALVCALAFGWSWARYFQTAHIQFAAGWPIPLFFSLLYRGAVEKRPVWLAAALWTWLAEFYLSVYVAYFLAAAVALMLPIAIAIERRRLREYRKAFWRAATSPQRRSELLASAAAAALALALLACGAARYHTVSLELGGGDPQDLADYGASFLGWLRPDRANLVWGRFASLFAEEPIAAWEKKSFIGWASLLLCLAGSLLLVKRPQQWFQRSGSMPPIGVLVSASLAVPLAIALVSDDPPPFDFLEAPIHLAQRFIPGAASIRATGRICLVLSFLSSFVAAVWVQRLARSAYRPLALGSVALAALVVLENVAAIPPAVDRCAEDRPWLAIEPRIAELTRSRGLGTIVFLPAEMSSPRRIFGQVPAMMLALRSGLRTINGYNGHWPPRLERLFHADPGTLACSALGTAVDAAHGALAKPTLIYVEQEGPLGPPGYRVDDVARCLRSCLPDATPVEIAGGSRRGAGLVTDPLQRCAAAAGP
jgi:hypothetical protein